MTLCFHAFQVKVDLKRFKTLRVWVRGEIDTTVVKPWNLAMIDRWLEFRGYM